MNRGLVAVLMFAIPCTLAILAVLLDNLLERWGVR